MRDMTDHTKNLVDKFAVGIDRCGTKLIDERRLRRTMVALIFDIDLLATLKFKRGANQCASFAELNVT